MKFNINKGIDRDVEFKGLRAQYLIVFAAGLIAVFLLFVVLYLSGVCVSLCILTTVIAATFLVWAVFLLNKKYGRFGLMKRYAARLYPRRIIHRRAITRLIRYEK